MLTEFERFTLFQDLIPSVSFTSFPLVAVVIWAQVQSIPLHTLYTGR